MHRSRERCRAVLEELWEKAGLDAQTNALAPGVSAARDAVRTQYLAANSKAVGPAKDNVLRVFWDAKTALWTRALTEKLAAQSKEIEVCTKQILLSECRAMLTEMGWVGYSLCRRS
jgi:hypothetical protein